jgi:hypothetical protein
MFPRPAKSKANNSREATRTIIVSCGKYQMSDVILRAGEGYRARIASVQRCTEWKVQDYVNRTDERQFWWCS